MPTALTITSEARASAEVPQPLVDPSRPLLTLDDLVRARASEMGDSPLIGYPNHSLLDFEEHSARSVDRYVDAAVEKLQQLGLPPVDPSLEKPPVVGILCQSGLHVVISIIALNRLGYTVFLISTRLAGPALDRLIELTGCSAILTTPNFHATLAEVPKERQPTLFPTLSRSDYYRKDAPVFSRLCDAEYESKKIAVILHSSGSTGLPKPIWLSHKSCIGAFSLNSNMRSLLASPLFHSHGFYEVFRSIYARKTIYLANYSLPLTRQSLLKMLDYIKPELFHCVPYLVKLLAESDAGIRALAKVNMVLFAGSSCPDDLGDMLVSRGVNLVANYGA
ncbi:putative nrps-like enzyme [Rosellinia necatrix]|uniref:Putative nrps-like enzyme n=1 Tax=Rosellinia necatrix TaxID=77044 RepID=A0A1S8ABB0_ROSNE|nr:putative nrps-like enzyme [Rosellinia necatrix]